MAFDPYEEVRQRCGAYTRLTGSRHAWALTSDTVLPAALALPAYGRSVAVEGLLRTELRLVHEGTAGPGSGVQPVQATFRATTVFNPDVAELCSVMGRPYDATLRLGGPLGEDPLELTVLIPAHLAAQERIEGGTWACHPFLDRSSGRRFA